MNFPKFTGKANQYVKTSQKYLTVKKIVFKKYKINSNIPHPISRPGSGSREPVSLMVSAEHN